jgi:VWFA-related protein
MRRLILAAALAAMTLQASGARRVTVAQLEEVLTSADAAHRADEETAHQVGELEMTERLTEPTLDRFAAAHKLGPRTALALELLSDRSAFLNPPAGELPATAFPDADAQKSMLDAARAYSVETWTRMPNFFVTRVTHRFDDGPHVLAKGDWPVRAGLQPVGTSSREVTFRDGKEVQDLPAEANASTSKAQQELGLRSWGEFGPELTVVLADMAKQSFEFAHWEQIGTRLAAVFHYDVPREVSHYSVSFCCLLHQQVIGRTQFGYSGRDRTAQQVANIPRTELATPYAETPGYQGTIAIDPASGAVLRITIQARLSDGDPLLRAETMVEYGPVTIGDRVFICPLRSIALSMEQTRMGGQATTANSAEEDTAWQRSLNSGANAPILSMNETRFVDYHRLGSTVRILADAAAAGTNPAAADSAASAINPPPHAGAGLAAATPDAAAAGGSPAQVQSNDRPDPAPQTSASAPSAPAPPAIPEVSLSAATGVPDQPADAPPNDPGGYSLKVTSRLVDVGLVAYDKKGRPVTDLKPDELEIYDNGHKQEIRSFSLADAAFSTVTIPAESPAPTAPADQDVQGPSFSNRTLAAPAAASTPASEVGSTILLVDESHIAWNDMSNARAQILRFLASLKPGERVGLYSMSGIGFRVLTEVTADHAALVARMQKFLPTAQSVAQAQAEETRNRQQFDVVHNVADLNSVNGNHTDVADGMQPIDPELLTMGDNPARASFIVLGQVARHLASIPGHKKLVWVASDNVLADWQDQSVGIDKSPKDVAGFALRTQEAMNDAHAAVYPFDVSQLEVGGVGADLQHANVQLTAAAADNATTAASAGGPGGASAPPSIRDTSPGRIDAAMSQDLHPVQGPVRQVAAATGGRVIRRSGDLTGQLDRIVADGHATYMLTFSPQGPADGQYHTISVKTTGRRGLTLSYRTGYLFDKEASTLKERFQQAIWRPVDISEIAISANVSAASDGANVKINIAAKDLGLQQHADRWMDKLDIFFIRRDDAGLHAQVEGQTLGLRLKSTTYESLVPEGVPFEHFVTAKPAIGSLRVLVVDENSGRMGSITIPFSALKGGQGE